MGRPGFYLLALLTLFLAYATVIAIAGRSGPAMLFATAFTNVLPVAALGFVVRALLLRLVFVRPAIVQAAAHLALGLLFSILWFWLLMVLLGALGGRNAVEFSVRPFLGRAATWQLFQGITIYGLLAAAAYAERLRGQMQSVEAGSVAGGQAQPFRVFVRQNDEIRPLDTDRIILIRAADDYSEIVTASGTHLVRLTLAELCERLGETFIRVHRSCLVNAHRIAKAESAGGGRMLLHMDSGEMITTSRAGARLLRERII